MASSSSSPATVLRRPATLPVRSSNSGSTSRTIIAFFRNTLSRTKLNHSFQISSSSSSFPLKLKIKCGVTEINESQFPEIVLKSDRPVLVEFVAGWCGPCRLIAPAIESISKVNSTSNLRFL